MHFRLRLKPSENKMFSETMYTDFFKSQYMSKFHLSIAFIINIRQVNQFQRVKEKLFIVVHFKTTTSHTETKKLKKFDQVFSCLLPSEERWIETGKKHQIESLDTQKLLTVIQQIGR